MVGMADKLDAGATSLGRSVMWSRAHSEDAGEMARVYNAWVAHGARVPSVQRTTEQQVRAMMADLQGRGYPLRCFWHADEVIGWSSLRPLNWGGSGTLGAVELSIYVAPDWIGLGVGAQAAFLTYRQIYALGFSSVTCWVMRENRLSRNMARGMGMALWGTLPQVVEIGEARHDVDIWGCQLNDPEWRARMDRLGARLERRWGGWVQEQVRPVAPLATTA